MTLGMPLPGGKISQHFGPSSQAIQPTMFHVARTKAFWQRFPGSTLNYNVHAGTDFAFMPAGSPLVAAEAGTVTKSYYDQYNGGGHVVEVTIKSGVRYSYNHCNSRLVSVGQKVSKGQKIATVGTTGTIWDGTKFVRSSYGVHCHAVLIVREKGSDGIYRDMIYNFADFMAGGPKAGSSLVKPPATSTTYIRIVKIRPGVNIRSSPSLASGANIAYVCGQDGAIYTTTGVKVGSVGTGFGLKREFTNEWGSWGEVVGFGRTLYVFKGLYY